MNLEFCLSGARRGPDRLDVTIHYLDAARPPRRYRAGLVSTDRAGHVATDIWGSFVYSTRSPHLFIPAAQMDDFFDLTGKSIRLSLGRPNWGARRAGNEYPPRSINLDVLGPDGRPATSLSCSASLWEGGQPPESLPINVLSSPLAAPGQSSYARELRDYRFERNTERWRQRMATGH